MAKACRAPFRLWPKVYDARLVAVSMHGLKTHVTFNVAAFRRYAGIEILHPRELVKG